MPASRSIVSPSGPSSKKEPIRERFRSVLRVNDTPHRVGLAFGIGVFIAFFPVMGVHTIMALALAWVCRLSAPVILAGTLVNNPWTFVPIYGGSFWMGLYLTGERLPSFDIEWSALDTTALWGVLKPVLWPFCVGTILAGTVAGFLAYGIVRSLVQTYQAERASQKPTTS